LNTISQSKRTSIAFSIALFLHLLVLLIADAFLSTITPKPLIDKPHHLNVLLIKEETKSELEALKENPTKSSHNKQPKPEILENTAEYEQEKELEEVDLDEPDEPSIIENSTEVISSLSMSPSSIRTFTDSYKELENTSSYRNSLEAFDRSFPPEPVGDLRPYNSVIERSDGIVDARFKILGFRICYTIDPGSENLFPIYYRCPKERQIKLDIKRSSKP